MIWSRWVLAEVLSHANSWFDYLNFIRESSIPTSSNQIRTLKWLWLSVSFDLKALIALICALIFLHRLETWSWKFSLRSIVTPRSFRECGFSMSKLLTDILMFISWLERKLHLSGFAFIALLKNHSNIFLDAHSNFFKNLFGNFPCVYGVLSST